MNPLFKQLIINAVRKNYQQGKTVHPQQEEQIRKKVHDLEIELSHDLTDMIYLILGIVSATLGLKGFLLPNHFIDGGVTGISLIVNSVSQISLGLLIFAFNLPFIIMGYFSIGKRFAFKSAIGILLLALSVHLVQLEAVTEDKILVAVFGGFFLGLGIGLAIRGGAIIDGTEVLAIYISKKSSMTVGNIILIFNLIIFLTSAYVLGVEIALYAILTYFAASKTVDFVIDGIEEYTGISIISSNSEQIRSAILNKLGRGCTIYKGEKGLSVMNGQKESIDIVFTVITRLELSKFNTLIDQIDPEAFIVMTSIKDTKGGMIKKKPLKKIK